MALASVQIENKKAQYQIVLFQLSDLRAFYLLPALFFGFAVVPLEVAWPADFEPDVLLLDELDFTVDVLLLL